MFNHKLSVDHTEWSDRANHLGGEGGALNAGYAPVDALCAISNHLGKHGLVYNNDWYWDGFSSKYNNSVSTLYTINLCFNKQEHVLLMQLIEREKV